MNLCIALSGQIMTVKTSRINFPKKFLTLTNHKLIFVDCESVSFVTGPPSFLGQRKALLWLAVLSSNNWLFVFNATRFRKKFLKIFDFFVLLAPFDIISHCPDIGNPNG